MTLPASVIFLPEAEAEIDASVRWYEGRRVGLGLEFLGVLDRAIARIAEEPGHFPAWSGDQRFRQAVLGRFPYVVLFEIRGDVIEIVAVPHGRRRPGFWRERLKR